MKLIRLTRSSDGEKILVNPSSVCSVTRDDDGSTCLTLVNNVQHYVSEGVKRVGSLIDSERHEDSDRYANMAEQYARSESAYEKQSKAANKIAETGNQILKAIGEQLAKLVEAAGKKAE